VKLMEQVDALGRAVERLPEEQEGLAARVTDVLDEIDELEAKWDVREDILKGLE
jgi:hypothetical protein